MSCGIKITNLLIIVELQGITAVRERKLTQ